MRTASVVEVKTRLGQYLELVGKGETVVVTSHRHPVARLTGVGAADRDALFIAAERPASDLDRLLPVSLPTPVDGVRDLLDDRKRR